MDEDALEVLRSQVEAKYEEIAATKRQNELAEDALKILQRTRNAEQQRVKMAFDTNDKVTGLLSGLSEILAKIDRIDKLCTELGRWLERTDDILILLLTEKSPQKIEEAREDLQEFIDLRQESKNKLVRKRIKNIDKLKGQAAEYGSIDTPLALLNKIEAEQEELDRLLG